MRGNYRIFLVYFSILFIGVAGYFVFVYFAYDDVGDKIPYEHFTKEREVIAQIRDIESESKIESVPQIAPESESKPESVPESMPEIAIKSESEPQIESESTPQSPQIPESRTYIINVNIANIRELPSTDSKIIGRFLQDEVVTITRTENGWGAVEGGGFVFMELLRE